MSTQLSSSSISTGFEPIVSKILLPRAANERAQWELIPQNFKSFLLHISETWKLMVDSAKAYGRCLTDQPTENIIQCIHLIISKFEQSPDIEGQSRDDLLELAARELRCEKYDYEALALLQFSVYVWSMCKIEIPDKNTHVPISFEYWMKPQFSLREQIKVFAIDGGILPSEMKLEKTFRLFNLVKVSKFVVTWVDNIFEHLAVEDPDPAKDAARFTIKVFHHRRFLKFHANRGSTIFPIGFIEETLKTLDLLLPYGHKETIQWYQQEVQEYQLDDTACEHFTRFNPLDRKIKNFKFWGERLSNLKEIYDELEPDTLSRFWLDKRKPVQWATFWVAVLVLALTVFFGLVQSVEGALQVYKSYHPS